MHRRRNLILFCIALAPACAGAQTMPPQLYQALVWRNIGPFRGGRVASVTGVIGQPGVFYMGLPAGGVWKTTGAGTTWEPIFDSVKEVSSVGAIEVAPSDPSVIYAGMGDMAVGGAIDEGNGVYKSTDGGKSWTHVGLDGTKHIPSIVVDPHDPNLVLVAAQGDTRRRNPERGLFRSTDGGKSWTKALYVDDNTGCIKIAYAYDKPEVLLAATSSGGFRGGFGGGVGGGASTTHIYKSIDRGATWKEAKGAGLPTMNGRIGLAVAMHTDARRMYAVGNFGLYRSDDGGDNWRQMDAADRRVANGQGGYNCGVYINPENPDVVYVVNTCCYRSLDGGNSFTGWKGAPGGDDPQQLWFDPTDGKRIFMGSDQGATVTLDGGLTWSSWYNQPTAQVYHISVDNQFPYWVYATQQDSGAIATASRGNYGEITPLDWLPHPGYEFGSIVADPLNPKVSYAGGEGGGIDKVTYPSGQHIDVSPSLDSSLQLRKVGNQPLAFSPVNPRELLAGFQYLMATTDGGRTWKKLSADLTRAPGEAATEGAPSAPSGNPAAPNAGAGRPAGRPGVRPTGGTPPPTPSAQPATGGGGGNEPFDEDEEDEVGAQRGFGGGAIESFSVSSVDGKVIWAGTSNGRIQVTKDHGGSWEDVTIPNLPNGSRSDISAIDASHTDPAAAYVAIDCHNSGDYTPYVYRTHDSGKSWTLITKGLPADLPSGSFARVVRADTKRAGLLYLGTESSVYVSFDDGDNWQSLALNLPTTSYRDMVVKDNDLVVGTYGRGFWILDDLSPLRQIATSTVSEPARLFKPGDSVRVRRNVNGDTPFPPEVPHALNPPVGALLYYYLSAPAAGEITLDVTDSAGKPVRHMSSVLPKTGPEAPPPVPDFWVEQPKPLPAAAGLSRTSWDLRYDNPPSFSRSYEINANPGETPPSPQGPLVAPGVYTVTLTVDSKKYSEKLTVRNDPRSPATAADLRAQHELQMKLYTCAREAWAGYQSANELRTAIAALTKANPPAEVATAAGDLDRKLTAAAGATGFGRRFGGGGFGGPGNGPRQPTFSGLNGTAVRQLKSLESGDMAPTEATRNACTAICADMLKAQTAFAALRTKELAALNALLAKNNLKQIGAPAQVSSTQR